MANSIRSAPGLALASRMACRSEPAPMSSVFRTEKTAGTARSSNRSTGDGRKPGRRDDEDRRLFRGRGQDEDMTSPSTSGVGRHGSRRPSAGLHGGSHVFESEVRERYGGPGRAGGGHRGV